MTEALWLDWYPELLHHVYWHRKEEFQLSSDRYAYWTLFAVVDGRFAYRIGGQEGTAKFPDLVLCPPGSDFERRVLEPLSFHFLQFHLVHRHGGSAKPSEPPFVKASLTDVKRLANTYSHLRTAVRQSDASAGSWADHLLKDLWHQHLFEQLRSPDCLSDDAVTTEDPVMAEAYRVIRESACTPLSLSAVAASLGLTPVQLTRKYRTAFGSSPSEHVTALRMQKAKALLSGTSYSLEKIAMECGYENGFYLSRIFSKRMGMSPSAFRKTYRI
ncbi:helix-turn-helix domain-containing protein [Gorillibacterium sp. sgz5001074]|uniref:helix-turn-helix domain-containing protein n=1 Tax=Gorillibacterium sp. sgz5001074 TaxID=3446695 RepID=UPI003F66155F